MRGTPPAERDLATNPHALRFDRRDPPRFSNPHGTVGRGVQCGRSTRGFPPARQGSAARPTAVCSHRGSCPAGKGAEMNIARFKADVDGLERALAGVACRPPVSRLSPRYGHDVGGPAMAGQLQMVGSPGLAAPGVATADHRLDPDPAATKPRGPRNCGRVGGTAPGPDSPALSRPGPPPGPRGAAVGRGRGRRHRTGGRLDAPSRPVPTGQERICPTTPQDRDDRGPLIPIGQV